MSFKGGSPHDFPISRFQELGQDFRRLWSADTPLKRLKKYTQPNSIVGAAGAGSAAGAALATGGATDTTANSGGLTVLGTTNKTIQWLSSNDKFNFNKGIELATGSAVTINGTDILTETTMMGKSITQSLGTDHTTIPTSGAVDAAVKTVSATAYYMSTV